MQDSPGVGLAPGFTLPPELLPDLPTVDSNTPSPAPSAADSEQGDKTTATQQKQLLFKNPSFTHANITSEEKKRRNFRVWKNAKQIAQAERALPWKQEVPLYANIEAPPSFKPAKKYSDLSGLISRYQDPHTKLRYANTDEYSRLKMLPSDIVAGLLTLRKASPGV